MAAKCERASEPQIDQIDITPCNISQQSPALRYLLPYVGRCRRSTTCKQIGNDLTSKPDMNAGLCLKVHELHALKRIKKQSSATAPFSSS